MFLIFLRRRICNYIENDKLLNEKVGHFLRRQKEEKKKNRDLFFLQHICLLCLLRSIIFFKNI